MTELREELTSKDGEVTRLQQEKVDLLREARAAKDYRDELDCLQHTVQAHLLACLVTITTADIVLRYIKC